MAKRNRLFLTGSERAEYEHIYGPLPVDQSDPRFVLVTDEEASRIRDLPAGVPIRALTQKGPSRDKITEHYAQAAEFAGQEFPAGTAPFADVNTKDAQGASTPASWGTGTTPVEPVGTTPAPKGEAGGDSTKKR